MSGKASNKVGALYPIPYPTAKSIPHSFRVVCLEKGGAVITGVKRAEVEVMEACFACRASTVGGLSEGAFYTKFGVKTPEF